MSQMGYLDSTVNAELMRKTEFSCEDCSTYQPMLTTCDSFSANKTLFAEESVKPSDFVPLLSPQRWNGRLVVS